jgi:hypothetical protein
MDVIWWVTAAVGAIAINLIASELFAWGPRLSEWLMHRAVRRLAPELQDRMQEEWAGHLQMIPPGLWRIVAASGFYLATRQINVALRVQLFETYIDMLLERNERRIRELLEQIEQDMLLDERGERHVRRTRELLEQIEQEKGRHGRRR